MRTLEPSVSWHIVVTNSNLPPQKYETWKKRVEELGKCDLATIPPLVCKTKEQKNKKRKLNVL